MIDPISPIVYEVFYTHTGKRVFVVEEEHIVNKLNELSHAVNLLLGKQSN
jgi:hypothetical protein